MVKRLLLLSLRRRSAELRGDLGSRVERIGPLWLLEIHAIMTSIVLTRTCLTRESVILGRLSGRLSLELLLLSVLRLESWSINVLLVHVFDVRLHSEVVVRIRASSRTRGLLIMHLVLHSFSFLLSLQILVERPRPKDVIISLRDQLDILRADSLLVLKVITYQNIVLHEGQD